MTTSSITKSILLCSALTLGGLGAITQHANAQNNSGNVPSLLITNAPLPNSLKSAVYTKPVEVRTITAQEVRGGTYYDNTSTPVTQRVGELKSQLGNLQGQTESLAKTLEGVQRNNESRTAEYFANIATINTQLQSGTTPGNPRLVSRLSQAEQHLENLNNSLGELNGLSVETAETASEAAFLLESARAAYGLSGAIEEDHIHLAELEDTIHSTIILIERLLNTVNDDVTRTSTYINTERNNLRTLALGVTNGDLYGQSLASRPFSNVGGFTNASYSPQAPIAPQQQPQQQQLQPLDGKRILAKIKFDRPDVSYEQPVYLAVTQALERYPNARFDLVAVNPTGGNAAEVAIETTRARRNAEMVLRTLTQQGLPMEKIDLSYSESAAASSSEVQLFVK